MSTLKLEESTNTLEIFASTSTLEIFPSTSTLEILEWSLRSALKYATSEFTGIYKS